MRRVRGVAWVWSLAALASLACQQPLRPAQRTHSSAPAPVATRDAGATPADAGPVAQHPASAPDRFARKRETLANAVAADDAEKMASQGYLQFLIVEQDIGAGPQGFQGGSDRAVVAAFGTRVMPDTGVADSDGHRRYVEMARVYVSDYNQAIRRHQRAQAAAQAETDARVAKKDALEARFRQAGCVVVSMTKVSKIRRGEYSFEVRTEQRGACRSHNGQRCQVYDVVYSYRPGGTLLDPRGIYRKTGDDVIGIDVSDPAQPARAASRDGAPVPHKVKTSRTCYSLYDQLEKVGPI